MEMLQTHNLFTQLESFRNFNENTELNKFAFLHAHFTAERRIFSDFMNSTHKIMTRKENILQFAELL